MQITLIFLAFLVVSVAIIYKVNGKFGRYESAILVAVVIISAVAYTLYKEDQQLKTEDTNQQNKQTSSIEQNVTILNTGGTFNKLYNPLTGSLYIPANHEALELIIDNIYNMNISIEDIITKDSLDFLPEDREFLAKSVADNKNDKIIIIHGTDTMSESAKVVAKEVEDKVVIFTGAMVPMSISQTEATLNISTAIGFLNADVPNGVYIAMHGAVVPYDKIAKNKELGKFLIKE